MARQPDPRNSVSHSYKNFKTGKFKGILFSRILVMSWPGTDTADIYLLKVNNENTRTMCEICSKLTIKAPERRH